MTTLHICENGLNSDLGSEEYETIFSTIRSMTNAYDTLLDIASTISPLEIDESRKLIKQLPANSAARDKLYFSYLKTAFKMALKATKEFNYDIDDAISSSLVGLTEAVSRVHLHSNPNIQQYVNIWIHQCIHRYSRPIWLCHYCPNRLREDLLVTLNTFNFEGGTYLCNDSFNYDLLFPDWEATQYKPSEFRNNIRFVYNQQYERIYLDHLNDYIEDDREGYFDHAYVEKYDLFAIEFNQQLKSIIDDVLNTLSEREQKILRLRFGFDGSLCKTLEQVSSIMHIPRERVRQIENKALRKLRHPSRKTKLADFCE